jgi:hypothetical protein
MITIESTEPLDRVPEEAVEEAIWTTLKNRHKVQEWADEVQNLPQGDEQTNNHQPECGKNYTFD